MTNQTVPTGMIMIDGKLVKRAELSRQQKLENAIIYNTITFSYMLACVKWYVRLCWSQWHKRKAWPSFPVTADLFGDDPASCVDVLRSYGVYACAGSIQWSIVWNKVNLRLLLLVSKSQWEYADNILAKTSCDDYQIVSNPGPKRDQALPRPYSQRQNNVRPAIERQAQSINPKSAKMGRTYS